jgi:hypothetical protein
MKIKRSVDYLSFNRDVIIEQIKKYVSEQTKIPVEHISITTRKKGIVLARQLCFFIIKTIFEYRLSLNEIAGYFEYKGHVFDHVTVLHSVTTIENYMSTNKRLKEEFTDLLRMCKEFTDKFRELTEEEILEYSKQYVDAYLFYEESIKMSNNINLEIIKFAAYSYVKERFLNKGINEKESDETNVNTNFDNN